MADTSDGDTAQGHEGGLSRLLDEAFGASARIHNATRRGDLVGVLHDDATRLDQLVDRKRCLVRPHGEDIADVHDGEIDFIEFAEKLHVQEEP